MLVITSEQMKRVEKLAIDSFLISEDLLMERAGISVVQSLWNEFGRLDDKNFVVICGTGNNGGDGYVIARDLLNYTEAVRVIATGEPKTEISKLNYERFVKHGGIVYKYDEIGLEKATETISSSDIVIDAIFGTGIKSEIQDENLVRLIELINIYSNCTVSVDIPSGVNTDNGKIMGVAVQAYMTVTFGFPKPGHLLFPGRDLTGKLKVAQIGIPSQIFSASNDFRRFLITGENLKKPVRPKWAHKKSFGEVLIIGGSKQYLGAPILSALGALKSGAGVVKILAPAEICDLAISHDPSLICYKVEEFNLERIQSVISSCSQKSVIVVGPGLSQENIPEKISILRFLIKDAPNPMIIDADGLNILSHSLEVLKERLLSKHIILTPHPGEFSRLIHRHIDQVKQSYTLAEEFSNYYEVITVLKDATTIITDGKHTYFNISGNTSLSKAGSGDILSGIIASLISQGLEPFEAAKTGVYLLGVAGEMIPNEGANSSFDVIRNIPEALNKI
uniref:Bifunctional NAD(P)H-hydrate repair enzyme n=1 Tax=Fervidobacterium nodosum TaxID=2424 RepID=A0A7C5U3E8_9BACT